MSSSTAKSGLQSESSQDGTVLVIDDSDGATDYYKRLLQQDADVSYQVLAASYDEPILDLCQSRSIDVILLEVRLSDGRVDDRAVDDRAFDWLDQLAVQISTLPPIIAVGQNDANLAVRSLKAGAVDYLIRDQVTPDQLRQSLQNAAVSSVSSASGSSVSGSRINDSAVNDSAVNDSAIADTTIADATPLPTREDISRQLALNSSTPAVDDALQTQSLLAIMMEAANAGWGSWNWLTGEAEWCDRGKQIMGFASDEDAQTVAGWLRRIHPDDRAQVEAHVMATAHEQRNFDIEYRIIHANGELRWLRGTGKTTCDASGMPVRSIGLVFDQTHRKRHDANTAFLAEVATEFSRLSTADEIMQTVGAKIGAYLNLSICAFAEINDAMTEAVISHAWHASNSLNVKGVYHLADFVTDKFLRQAQNRETVVIRDVAADLRTDAEKYAALNIGSYVSVPFHKDRTWKFLFSVYDAVPRDWRADEIQLIHELSSQVFPRLERAHAEAVLRESEQRLSAIFAQAAVGLSEISLDGQFEQVNDKLCRLLGRPRDVLLEASTVEVTHPDDVPKTLEALAGLVKTGGSVSIDKRYLHPDGTVVWANSIVTRLDNEQGQPQRFLVVTIDLSDRKRAEVEREQLLEREQAAREEAERANRMKDEFLAILSHELRSPLNPILGWAKLLQVHKMDEAKIQQGLGTIERNVKLQTQLIDDLLDVAKILRGKLKLEVTSVDLASVIGSAVEVVRTAAEAKSISLRLDIIDTCHVKGDQARLQQIVWNLLANAIKFTSNGGHVEVRLEQVPGEGNSKADAWPRERIMDVSPASQPRNSSTPQFPASPAQPATYARITVADTGRGISPDFLPHIFESFRQADTSTTRQYGGLGLGLSIVKHLVDAHGGTITAHSAGEGQGATFTILFPLMIGNVKPSPTHAVSFVNLDLAGTRVLAVDDIADAREFLATLLNQYGAEVKVVSSGQEVLAHLATFKPNVLVCDIGMPEMDGYALIRRVRALPPEQSGDVPAIALTAYVREEDAQQALKQGFQKHISKPLEPEYLARAIAELTARTESA